MRCTLHALALVAALAPQAFAGTNDFGLKFLEENKEKDGVLALPSGLQYKVLRRGTGNAHPTANSPCECHYEGRTAQNFPQGDVFDSSYARGQPTTFAPNQVIKGWTEAMQLMVEGDKWEMYIPSELGYGDRGSPPKIGGGDVLVFTMEIVKIKGDSVPAVRCNHKTGEDCSEEELAYIKKSKAKNLDKLEQEIVRLKSLIDEGNMGHVKLQWMKTRHKLLSDILMVSSKEEL